MVKELPRLMTTKQLEAYLGVTWPTIQKMVELGLLPRRLHGMSYWDRKAVDAHLDRASGLDKIEPEKSMYERHKENQYGQAEGDPQAAGSPG
jgi:hypothetical protein